MPEFTETDLDATHLYIHVPFCSHCCPYCPYNKIQVDRQLADSFFKALETEIEMYYDAVGRISITSIYFGGGSPALFPQQISNVIDQISNLFDVNGEYCIEINPTDCTTESLQILKNAGIKTVSVGVQSFQDSNLSIIGRAYNGKVAEQAVENVCRIFDSVNIDLMFALPEQTNENLLLDVEKALSYGVSQITTYPLFTFPYSKIGSYKKIKKVKMPHLGQRRTQYFSIYDKLMAENYNQVSVWSFKKDGGNKYSSVTRDGYLGMGAGAGSHLSTGFYLNTFPVKSYIQKLGMREFPTALKFEMDTRMQNFFWLYWRFYDTRIPIIEFENRFAKEKKILRLFSFLQIFGMLEKTAYNYVLTRQGSFWLHLAQNYFSLQYVNKIWTQAMHIDFPDDIEF